MDLDIEAKQFSGTGSLAADSGAAARAFCSKHHGQRGCEGLDECHF
jgi:hypothetical protein